jgi:hypothetical protein
MSCCVQAARSSQQNEREKQTFFSFFNKINQFKLLKMHFNPTRKFKALNTNLNSTWGRSHKTFVVKISIFCQLEEAYKKE